MTIVEGKLRAIDLSMGWAGPLAGEMLAEMGAQVIKIEDTLHFDWWRGSLSMGPPELQVIERASTFNTTNRGKLGVTLDLSNPRAVEIVKQLIATADILIENYSPDVMERLGLSWKVLQPLNPRLIMISMPSFGSEGPERNARGYGNTVEAAAGVTGLMGYHDSPQPYTMSNALGDPVSGLNAMFAVLVGLREREETGRGQLIELAQVEGTIPLIGEAIVEYQITGKVPRPRGNRHPQHAPHGIYQCAGSGWIAIAAESDDQWRKLAGALGTASLARDPRFATESNRKRNEDALDAELSSLLKDRGADETARILIEAGLLAGQVHSSADVLGDPQLSARGFFVPIDRAIVGTYLYPGAAEHFSETPLMPDRPAPLLGEHNRMVFREILAIPDAEIDALEKAGIIGTEPRR
ncbi:MAG TPA: CoA transferase [Candidatus Binataceae bacterium]|nr:CoA transferase [Candidatus Binataceae bacterium]